MAEYKYVRDSGLVIVDASNLRTDIENEYKAIFGQDLVTTSNTPQGRLIDAQVLGRRSALETVAAMANQINPQYSTGPFLESLCSFLELERDPATLSRLSNVKMTGRAFSNIPMGSLARDQNGYSWRLDHNVALNENGEGRGTFYCTVYGPIECAVGDLNRVASNILTWETVSNPEPAIVGQPRQSDRSLRRQRNNTLAKLATSGTYAIVSQLYDAPTLARSVTFRENITDEQQTIDGIDMPPHSLWTCVQGGAVEDIAEVLLDFKTVGAQWVGDVSYTLYEEYSRQEYVVQFARPKEVLIDIEVEVLQGSFPGQAVQAVTDALFEYADGNIEGFAGFIVKENEIIPADIITAIRQEVNGIKVYDVRIKKSTDDTFDNAPIQLNVGEIGKFIKSSINVIVRADING